MNFDCHYNWRARFDYRAQLATPYIGAHNEPRCMHFYYYMYGRNVDFLQVYYVPFGYTLSIDPQWIMSGNQGNKWEHGTLDLPPTSDPYRVCFLYNSTLLLAHFPYCILIRGLYGIRYTVYGILLLF